MNTITDNKKITSTGTTGYYIAIAINIILLYFFNNLRFLNLPFIINDELISCLWAINLALSFGIISNFVLLLYRPEWFHHLTQAVILGLAGLSVYIVYRIFPFTFNTSTPDTITRVILIILMAAAAIGLIVEFVKLWMANKRKGHF